MASEHKYVNAPPTLAEIDAMIRASMDSPECVINGPIARTVFEAGWFASELRKVAGWLARLPDGTTYDEVKLRVFEDLDRAADAVPADNPDWDSAGYVYNSVRGENDVGALFKLAEALEAAIPAAPAYADGLLRRARGVRELLARSEIEAQAAVRRAVTKERRWYMLWSAAAIGGLFYLWGRPLSFMVGLGFLCCVSVLAAWLKAGRARTEVARRCAEIGWPLGK